MLPRNLRHVRLCRALFFRPSTNPNAATQAARWAKEAEKNGCLTRSSRCLFAGLAHSVRSIRFIRMPITAFFFFSFSFSNAAPIFAISGSDVV